MKTKEIVKRVKSDGGEEKAGNVAMMACII
jgi:hypothetical protein